MLSTLTLLPTLEEIHDSQKLVYSVMPPTPHISWPLINQRLETEAWVKHENHTPTGSFKARTAIAYAAELFKHSTGIKGLITATRGNHGQSVALAGQRFNVPVTIVVPHGNSSEKNAAMRGQDATLIEFGDDYQAAREHAQQLAKEQHLQMVPPYHRDIVKGVASYWVEFLEAVPDLDIAYVPVGMGSGISAACAVRNGMNLRTQIVGVVSDGAPAYALSFAAGKKIEAPVTTKIADGMACRIPDDEPLEIMRENVDHVVTVSDDDIRRAMKIYFTDTHNAVEGAGAASLAAALKEKAVLKGKKVGLILSGANVDHDIFAKVLQD
jgi:threonine dehydratase